MTTPFNPSPEFTGYALEVLAVVERVTGTPRLAIINGSKCNRNTRAKVVFRECMRRALNLSTPRLAHLLGVDHSLLVRSGWRDYEVDVDRCMALLPPWQGRQVAVVKDYLCPTCGQQRSQRI
jgi:hypothetical protein